MSELTIPISALLSKSAFDALIALAARRGVSANTVLTQAIETEKLLADNVRPDDQVLIQRGDKSFSKVEFATGED